MPMSGRYGCSEADFMYQCCRPCHCKVSSVISNCSLFPTKNVWLIYNFHTYEDLSLLLMCLETRVADVIPDYRTRCLSFLIWTSLHEHDRYDEYIDFQYSLYHTRNEPLLRNIDHERIIKEYQQCFKLGKNIISLPTCIHSSYFSCQRASLEPLHF